MILSRKLATSLAFFISLAASSTPTNIRSTDEAKNGLSLSDYDSILFTDIRKELGASLSDDNAERLWREATANEWKLSEDNNDDVHADSGLRRVSNNAATPVATHPFVVCQKDPTSGYEFKQIVVSEFGSSIDNLVDVYNGRNMACVMMRAYPSVARRVAASSSSSLLVQPLFPAMKIAAGTVDSIMDDDSRDDDGKVSVQLSAQLCPGGSSAGSAINAAKVGRTIVDAVRQNKNNGLDNDEEKEEGAILAIAKRFLRLSEDYDNERSELWKSAFADTATADHSCDHMFSKTFTSGGYKGESFSVGQRFEKDDATKIDIPVPIDASPSCLLSLVAGIAASPEVCFVEISPEMELRNAQSQWIIQSGEEEERPWFDVGLDGTDQVVAVSDSGLDMQNCYFLDGAGNVEKDGSIKDISRKVIQYVPRLGDSTDAGGHGTHVCGTVAGRRALQGGEEDTGAADGIAREAKLSIMDIGVGYKLVFPPDFQELFGPGQEAGARIHTAAWGASTNIYDSGARQFDSFTVDNPDFLSIVAAGNDGADPPHYDRLGTVGTPATAKNIISVGATESYGQELNSPGMIGFEYLAFMSSRGPTADGRTKPDVSAPGYSILSASSSGTKEHYTCDYNRGTKYMAGTSASAPAVSGTAALVRQYLVEGWYPSGKPNPDDSIIPSAALMKAVLMNGAQFLKGVSNQGRISDVNPYDNHQNYGRISLIDSLYLDGINDINVYMQDGKSLDGFNKERSFTAVVDTSSCSTKSVSVTLVWTDPVGYTNCQRCIMNDLDLLVTKNGQDFFPNGLDEKDDLNTNERVQVDVKDGDKLVVTVSTSNLSTSEQNYAIVMTGCFTIDN